MLEVIDTLQRPLYNFRWYAQSFFYTIEAFKLKDCEVKRKISNIVRLIKFHYYANNYFMNNINNEVIKIIGRKKVYSMSF